MTRAFMKVSTLICIFCGIVGCNYNNPKNQNGDVDFQFANLESPDFDTVFRAVIAPKCLGCHAMATGNKGQSNLETYNNVRTQLNKIRFRVFEDNNKPMPPEGSLSEIQKKILLNWYDSGAPEHPVAGGEKPDPDLERGAINWDKIRVKIFQKKCSACHFPSAEAGGPPPEAGLDLSQYAMVAQKASLIFDRAILKQDMPISPFPALNPRERRVLLKWFELGMPN